jgi:hypothetical protein
MRDIHVWNMLGVHVPNVLPKTVFGSHFPRPMGRLIWSTLLLTIGIVAVMIVIRRPKKSNEPITWVQAVLGAMFVWVMLTLAYGVVPHEWLIFGNSYLNFDTTTFILRRGQWGAHLPPFEITRDKFVDAVAAGIYVVMLGLNIYLFAAWQKRKVAEPAVEAEASDEPASDEPGGPLRRLRARREKRVSAFGRPVTTTTES